MKGHLTGQSLQRTLPSFYSVPLILKASDLLTMAFALSVLMQTGHWVSLRTRLPPLASRSTLKPLIRGCLWTVYTDGRCEAHCAIVNPIPILGLLHWKQSLKETKARPF